METSSVLNGVAVPLFWMTRNIYGSRTIQLPQFVPRITSVCPSRPKSFVLNTRTKLSAVARTQKPIATATITISLFILFNTYMPHAHSGKGSTKNPNARNSRP